MLQQLPPANAATSPPPLFAPSFYRTGENYSSTATGPAVRMRRSGSSYRYRIAENQSATATGEPEVVDQRRPPEGTSALGGENSASAGAIVAFLAFAILSEPWRDSSRATQDADALRQEQALRARLTRSLELEPVEAGYSHPAVQTMEEAIDTFGPAASRWIMAAYMASLRNKPAVAADLLRCIGRLPRHKVQPWATLIAIGGLLHPDPEVREAAVRALEIWGDRDSLDALKLRVGTEPLPWLADYMRQVIADLSE